MGAASHRDKKLVYHLTAIDNLPSIWERGLLSRNELLRIGLAHTDVADSEILAGRAEHDLDSMVPFHFMARNPFDYKVLRQHPDVPFALLAVRRTFARTNDWLIIPKHPLSDHVAPDILDWEAGMDAIDWSQFDRKDRDWSADAECKKTCMAEALSPRTVEASAFAMMWVRTDEDARQVRRLLGGARIPNLKVAAWMFPNP